MNRKIFELALERLRPSDWEYFETLCAQFLVSEYYNIRNMANPSGDGGRDSELFTDAEYPDIVFQYSVTSDWQDKISKTHRRLKETFPNSKYLIFLSNQQIGASGDKIKARLRKEGIVLDIRDMSWFLDRYDLDDTKINAATVLVDVIAKPYLEGEEIIQKKRPALTSQEAKAALTYLSMQWEDETTEKGLTKIAFESLVRAALRKTNSESRLTRKQIHDKINSYLSSSATDEVSKFIDIALSRLTKKQIRHWTKEDEFCLSHSEITRLEEKLTIQEIEENEFVRYINKYLSEVALDYEYISEEDINYLVDRIVKILDLVLVKSGENFAMSVSSGLVNKIDTKVINEVIYKDQELNLPPRHLIRDFSSVSKIVIIHVLSSENRAVIRHIKRISDTYTLFFFLRETPDIQAATKKIFSYGKIWLDSTVVLPLLAESLMQEEEPRRYTKIFKVLIDSGVELFVTDGVINEVLYHIKMSAKCSRKLVGEWQGRIPFLYSVYLQAGYKPGDFTKWIENFRGQERPDADFQEYLEVTFKIKKESLESAAEELSQELKFAVQRLWQEAHEARRNNQEQTGGSMLVKNDVESYLGIIALRKYEQNSDLGYKHWWLTIDSLAWKIRDRIKDEFRDKTPSSPLISLDYLSNMLSFGPSRSRINRTVEQELPLFLGTDVLEFLPNELLEVAEKVRNENEGLPELVIRRKVRDACDKLKRRYGENMQQSFSDN